MKFLFLIFSVFAFNMSFTQIDTSKYVIKDTLSSVYTIKENTKIIYNTIEIKLETVLEDSRCPKDVLCVKAGEAKAKVVVSKDGEQLQTKTIIIYASGIALKTQSLIFENEDFSVFTYKLLPYPDAKSVFKNRDYQLEVLIQPKQNTLN